MRIVCLVILLCVTLLGAAIDGQWKTTIKGDHGRSFEEVLDFKVEGAKLSGTFSRGKEDKNPIEDGSVDGDKVKFFVTMVAINGDRARCKFEGTLKGDALELEMTIANGPTMEKMFKRAK